MNDEESEEQIKSHFEFLPRLNLCLNLLLGIKHRESAATTGSAHHAKCAPSDGKNAYDPGLELSSQVKELLQAMEQAYGYVLNTPQIDVLEEELLVLARRAKESSEPEKRLEELEKLGIFNGKIKPHFTDHYFQCSALTPAVTHNP